MISVALFKNENRSKKGRDTKSALSESTDEKSAMCLKFEHKYLLSGHETPLKNRQIDVFIRQMRKPRFAFTEGRPSLNAFLVREDNFQNYE